VSGEDAAKPDPRHAVGVKLFRSGLVNLVNFAVSIPVMLLLVPFLLRELGAEGYGIWTAANTLIGLTGMLNLGLVGAVTKFAAEHIGREEHEELDRVVSSALAVHGAIALALVALGLAFQEPVASAFFRARPGQGPLLAAVLVATLALFMLRFPLQSYGALITGTQRQDLVQTINLGSTLAFAVAAVALLASGRGVVQLVWAAAAVSGLATLATVIVARRLHPRLRIELGLVDRATTARVMSFGFRVAVSAVSSTLHLSADKMTLISGLGRKDLVGLYHIALETVEKIHLIPVNVLGPVMASASELHARGEHEALQGLYRRSQRYNAIVCALMFGGAFAVGGPFIRVWLGSEQQLVVNTMQVLAIGFFAISMVLPAMHLLNGMGHPGVTMSASFFGSLANVVLSLAIGFGLGAEHIAWGTTLSLVLESAWLFLRFQAHTGYPARETFVPELRGVIVSAVVAGFVGARIAEGAARANPAPLFVGGLVYCALYAGLILLTGALDRRDWPVVRRLMGRR
jgi:O-antigen/teichoic acid export membrane protein